MKKVSILGSTGSIGTNTLNVIRQHREAFEVTGIAAGSNVELIKQQIEEFHPKIVSVATKALAEEIKQSISQRIPITYGIDGLTEVATHSDANFVVSAVVGSLGLIPTLEAIKAGKDIGLANKETLVSAGHLVMEEARRQNVRIIPVDSEHSAIFQCLQGERSCDIERIILTASGGSFRHLSREQLTRVTLEEALHHPNWKMGPKVTIDSATMMNKGLEVIEAHWLFSLPFTHIDVLIHYESIIHSMVEFKDGAVMAQLGTPDMKVPIQYALSYPGRMPLQTERLHLSKIGKLHFYEADFDRYPSLRLAYEAGKEGGTCPTVLNAANESVIHSFVHGQIDFWQIEGLVEAVLEKHVPVNNPNLDEIIEADHWARNQVDLLIKSLV